MDGELADAIEALRHALGMEANQSAASVVHRAAMAIKHNKLAEVADPNGWREYDRSNRQ